MQCTIYSGIGPAEHLKSHDIKVLKDLPAVGSNLQDHFAVSVSYSIPILESIVSLEVRPWVFIVQLFKYILFGTGYLLAPILQLAIFVNSKLLDDTGKLIQGGKEKTETLPDIEIMPVRGGYLSVHRPSFRFLKLLDGLQYRRRLGSMG